MCLVGSPTDLTERNYMSTDYFVYKHSPVFVKGNQFLFNSKDSSLKWAEHLGLDNYRLEELANSFWRITLYA